MPTYEYRCRVCGSTQELLINTSEGLNYLPLYCKKCNKEEMHLKRISLTNFKFKNGAMNKDTEK